MTKALPPPRYKRQQRWIRFGIVLAIVIASTFFTIATTTQSAYAHGAMTSPASRTYTCYLEGPETPQSDACKAAVAAGGTQPLYDWFAVLISNAAGHHRELIPDGQLCGAGTTKYAAYNAARADWPATNLQSGAQFTFLYGAWVPHPGTFEFYVTKDSYIPTQPLKWSDLEAAPFLTATNPPIVNNAYQMSARLPANKSGRHIIYSIWQRSDSPEAFYGCSDVIFNGGGTPTPTPTVTPTSTATATPSQTATPTPGTCNVHYTINQWYGGFTAYLTVTNTGSAIINGWNLKFAFPGNQQITQSWNGLANQQLNQVTFTNVSWNATIATNGTVSPGFNASWSGSNAPPTAFTLNGSNCSLI